MKTITSKEANLIMDALAYCYIQENYSPEVDEEILRERAMSFARYYFNKFYQIENIERVEIEK